MTHWPKSPNLAHVHYRMPSPLHSVWLNNSLNCTIYNTTTPHIKVNDLRQELFPNRVKLMKKLPPTRNALVQHVNRCLYQANIWRESLNPNIGAPPPEGFGRIRADNGWSPVWTSLPAAALACRELIKLSSVVARHYPLAPGTSSARTLGLHAHHSASVVEIVRYRAVFG